jgi:predicted phage terminase large subunit-like protein
MYPAFEAPWHIRQIAAALEDVEAGRCKRLMIFAPPRHGKSLLTSQAFPAWYLGRKPDSSVIFASYSQDLASDFGRRVRNLVSSEEHVAAFPASVISRDSSSVQRFDTTLHGAYRAVGRGGPLTGRGAHVLLIDDPLKDHEEADSETVRASLHEWYGDVAYTRLAPGGAIVIINTRWHEDDLSGYLLANHADENWRVLSFPAIAEEDDENRKEGEPLWPGRFPLEALDAIRKVTRRWPALYQQRPSAVEGETFKRSWWRYYARAPERFQRVIQSWDTAFKKSTKADYSVCSTWGETATEIFLLHVWRERVEFPALLEAAKDLGTQWKPHVVLVEDKASGQSLVQVLREATRLPVIPVPVDTDKQTRASAATPTVQAGRVLLPVEAGWLTAFLDELSAFPNAAHDDQVDTVTMALEYMRLSVGGDAVPLVGDPATYATARDHDDDGAALYAREEREWEES